MTPTPYGLGQLLSMPNGYRSAPAIVNGPTGVFGTEEEQQAAAEADRNKRLRFDLEMRVSRSGAGAVVDGVNPQIRPNLMDKFSWEYQGGGKVVGFDHLLRGSQRPSVVDAANRAAAKEKEESTITWQLNQWVNQNPALALVALAGLWYAAKSVAPMLSRNLR